MADELTLAASVKYTKGSVNFTRALNKSVTVTGTVLAHAVQNIGTSEETLGIGEVTLSGYAVFLNLDSTNYIELGKATGVYSLKLKAGEFAIVRLDSWAAAYAKANTGAVDLEFYLFSD